MTTISTIDRPRLTLWLCFAVAVLDGYDLQAMAIAGPALRAAMQLDPRQLGFAFSASLIGLALGAAYGGRLADRIGRKQVLIVSLLALGMMTVATALATDFRWLVTLRILAGLAMGGVMPNLIAIAASASRGERATTKVAAMICGMPAGGVVASMVGHALIARYGWQGLFVLGGVLTVVIIPALLRWLAEPGAEQLGLTAARTAAASWRESLFGERRALPTLLLWVLFIFTLAIFSTVAGWVPTLVVDKGLPAAVGYQSLLAINVGGIAGALILSSSCDRWGVRPVMLATYAAMAISLWLFSSAATIGAVVSLAGLVGFWMLGAQCALYGISPQIYPAANCSTGVGSAVAAGRIGSILGPVIAGYMMGQGTTANQLIFIMAPLAVLAGAVLLALAASTGNALRAGAH
ncbi:MFS transporter [Duganella sp. FT80W]|uniref:MFS transporter n=1 Tax=Duganella guangzhouensis TaxID=2666084 RepID=A0A6I2KSQ7_9BURK|nr:MFS transporter [Duganella guangzhouensis]MRW88531.1 MFS transporter [Duganella guangzhouensis]